MSSPTRAIWDHKFELAPGKWVHVPDEKTKQFGFRTAAFVREHWSAPAYYFHLRKGGHIAALRSHLGHKYFGRADIENFFGKIIKNRILRHLKKIAENYEDARTMASMSVVPNPENSPLVLPFGFPQSTILASLCLAKSRLGTFIDRAPSDITVSVYVDDIIVSTDQPQCYLLDFFQEMVEHAKTSGLPFGKHKLAKPSTQVSAFNIEMQQNSLALTQDRFCAFRDRIIGDEGIGEEARLAILAYAESINPDQAHQLSTTRHC